MKKLMAIHNGETDNLALDQGSRITSRVASVLNQYRNE